MRPSARAPGVETGDGAARAASIALGLVAILRRDVARHRAWMLRGYAIGMGAGTQVLTLMPWALAEEPVGEGGKAVSMAAGWLINLAVAEWAVHRGGRRTPVPVRAGDR
ncbi:DUF2306 domain-containing protein [Streptomonospora sp. S1-112]|uniref:DUF2306 domain-containing protein n=1 Tax=Streptomonospora mangrovi TaxID=2883123 RepID=A0A9X3NIJ5_9ACTN|nr:DUF2306 domain-containing protein [Streptomonospora mangrovi]MDA0563828.1 DUF2306 domain-containing protein [Streptomonospora mangrovi]